MFYQMSLPNEGVWLGKIEIKLMYHPYPLKLKFAVTNKIKCFFTFRFEGFEFFLFHVDNDNVLKF